MANNIDPYPEGVAQLPFEDARIPTQTTTIEDPDDKPGAFEGDGAAAGAVNDATIEDGKKTDVPVKPLAAAAELAGDERGKSVNSGKTQESATDPAISKTSSSDDSKKNDDSDEKPQTRRGRRAAKDDSDE